MAKKQDCAHTNTQTLDLGVLVMIGCRDCGAIVGAAQEKK